MTKRGPEGLVRIYPLSEVWIPGIPHVVQDVSPAEATHLTTVMAGCAFTTDANDPRRITYIAPQDPPTEPATPDSTE